MSRERMIYPEIWDSDDFMSLSLEARLLWIGLITLADDHGKGKFVPKILSQKIYAGCDKKVQNRISFYSQEIADRTMAVFYEHAGHLYYLLPNWDTYQRLRYRKRSFIPDYDEKLCTKNLSQKTLYQKTSAKEGEECKEGEEGEGGSPFVQKDWGEHLRIWNEEIAPIWGLPRIKSITGKRRSHLRARLAKYPEFWEEVRREVPLMKEAMATHGFFKFNWIIESEDNYLKLIEGSYRRNGATPGKSNEDSEKEYWQWQAEQTGMTPEECKREVEERTRRDEEDGNYQEWKRKQIEKFTKANKPQ